MTVGQVNREHADGNLLGHGCHGGIRHDRGRARHSVGAPGTAERPCRVPHTPGCAGEAEMMIPSWVALLIWTVLLGLAVWYIDRHPEEKPRYKKPGRKR